MSSNPYRRGFDGAFTRELLQSKATPHYSFSVFETGSNDPLYHASSASRSVGFASRAQPARIDYDNVGLGPFTFATAPDLPNQNVPAPDAPRPSPTHPPSSQPPRGPDPSNPQGPRDPPDRRRNPQPAPRPSNFRASVGDSHLFL